MFCYEMLYALKSSLIKIHNKKNNMQKKNDCGGGMIWNHIEKGRLETQPLFRASFQGSQVLTTPFTTEVH